MNAASMALKIATIALAIATGKTKNCYQIATKPTIPLWTRIHPRLENKADIMPGYPFPKIFEDMELLYNVILVKDNLDYLDECLGHALNEVPKAPIQVTSRHLYNLLSQLTTQPSDLDDSEIMSYSLSSCYYAGGAR